MAPHTITTAVRWVCHCKTKKGLGCSPLGLHRRTRLSSMLRLNLDSRVVIDDLVPFRCNPISSGVAPLQACQWVGVKRSTRNGHRDPKCPSARHIRMVLDESRSFFRVHTGYFSNIPKCIKAEFIARWGCSQSSVVSSSQR
ncbi:uncharacterized protein TNCV_3590561 [Trichonephila clavipes]|nr:uncharacterized protein TNCV_3590561 [Trichonephila clavipes]